VTPDRLVRKQIFVSIYSKLVALVNRHKTYLVSPPSINPVTSEAEISTREFRKIAEDSVLGIIVNGMDRTPLYVNQRCADIFGYDEPQDIIDLKDNLKLVSTKDMKRVSKMRDFKQVDGNRSVTFEFDGVRKDGNLVPVFGNAAIVEWQGQTARYTTFLDLSDIKNTEQKLIDSEERFRQFATVSSDWFWEMDSELRYTFISDNFADNGGPSREEFLGQTSREAYRSLDKSASYEEFIRKLEAHEPLVSLRVKRAIKGQFPTWVLINAMPVLDNNKQFRGYRGTTIDITELVLTEEELQNNEERYNRATRGAKVTIWDWIIETNEYYVSDEAALIYGYTEENKPRTRDDWNALVHPDDIDDYTQKFLAHLKQEADVFEHEYRLRHADGTYHWIAVQGSALRDEQGKAWRVSGWGVDITEQRNTERLLVEAIDSLSEGFALYDSEDKLIAFNQQYAGMFTSLGIKTRIGQTFESNYREVLSHRAVNEGGIVNEKQLAKLVQDHLTPPPYSERQIHDGRWIRTTEVRTPSGGVAGLRTDITEYRNLLDQLAQSEERFRAFAEVASDWYYEVDKDLRFTFMSEGIQRERDIDFRSAIGRTHEDVFAEFADHQSHQEYLEDLKKHLPKRDILLRRKEGNGQTKWSRVNIIPKFTKNGDFNGYYGSGRDVTRQVAAQQALAHKEAQVSGMLEIAPDAIIAVNKDLSIQIFNYGAVEMFGYQDSEVIGKSLNMLIPDRFHSAHDQQISSFNKSKETSRRMGMRGEITGLKKDGTEFPAEASISRLEQGDDILYTVMLHDIGERKKSEEIVQKAMEEALYANRAKSEFLANMSHELRTPLNAILGFSEALRVGIRGALSENQNEYVDAVSQSGEHLLSLINDILDLSKLEAGKADLDEENLNLVDLINQGFLFVGDRARSGQISLALDNVPDEILLRADKRMILQILINLLSNAVKFTLPDGTVTVSVEVTPDKDVVLSVTDTGIGMRPEDIPQALSTFGQLDGDLDRRHEGTGLGLPLVKSLAELHGGVLNLTSEAGVGTVAAITIPRQRYLENDAEISSLI
jgi:PAS domain S-box-containing protein